MIVLNILCWILLGMMLLLLPTYIISLLPHDADSRESDDVLPRRFSTSWVDKWLRDMKVGEIGYIPAKYVYVDPKSRHLYLNGAVWVTEYQPHDRIPFVRVRRDTRRWSVYTYHLPDGFTFIERDKKVDIGHTTRVTGVI